MPPSERDPSRLARAIQLGLQFRAAGRTDTAAFLGAHEDLRELLAPILDRSLTGDEDDADGDVVPRGPGPGGEFAGYLLERELGRGGMGTVYLARQPGLGRRLALKVLSAPTQLVAERSLARFQREAKLLAGLDHPGLVRVFDAGVHDGVPFFAMELVRGATWAELLTAVRRSGLPGATGATLRAALLGSTPDMVPARTATDRDGDTPFRLPADYRAAVVTLAAEVAEALAHAHAVGVVHRDVKPSNVLVREDGRALLVDFGVAHQDGAATLTATGDLAGTPTYMAPEQARGGTVDSRTDIWALGVTLYEALTLQVPFAGENQAQVLDQLLHAEARDPRQHDPGIGADLAAVTGKALEKDPARRYQTSSDFAAELRAVLAGQPVRARLPNGVERAWRWMRREPWRAAAGALVVGALLAVLVVDQLHAGSLRAESQRRTAALHEVNRLAIAVRLDRAIAAARTFHWPGIEALPAIAAWQRQHHAPLAAELPGMEAMLLRLRAAALPYGPAEAAADRASHPDRERLAKIDDELAVIDRIAADQMTSPITRRQDLLLREQTSLRQRVDTRRTWRFADGQRQFLHDQVAVVVDRLRRFVAPDGEAQQLQRRAAAAVASHRRCSDEAAAAWSAVAADIAADPRFSGLQLPPQRDLLPLGKDPASRLWEFAHLPSGQPDQELPLRRDDGSHAPRDGFGIVFVLLPGGTFARGAQATDATGRNFDPAATEWEGPVQDVTLDPFFLGKFEVTRSQWSCLTGGENPATPTDIQPKGLAPVDSVPQQRARDVLNDFGLDLPTESQWEYGCRAGTDTPWHFGSRQAASKYANFAGVNVPPGAPHDADVADDGHRYPTVPGTFAGNAYGLHDMHGNVDEYPADRLARYGHAPLPGRGAARFPFDEIRVALRGGSNQVRLVDCRVSRRGVVRATSAMPGAGLRAARQVQR